MQQASRRERLAGQSGRRGPPQATVLDARGGSPANSPMTFQGPSGGGNILELESVHPSQDDFMATNEQDMDEDTLNSTYKKYAASEIVVKRAITPDTFEADSQLPFGRTVHDISLQSQQLYEHGQPSDQSANVASMTARAQDSVINLTDLLEASHGQ